MTSFTIDSQQNLPLAFSETVRLDLHRPIRDQIPDRKIRHERGNPILSKEQIYHRLRATMSLRADFGWAFEAPQFLEEVVNSALKIVLPKYNIMVPDIASNYTCSWIGFLYTESNSMYLELAELGSFGMILLNNEIVDYQFEVIELISKHNLFIQHAILRDEKYRYTLFKNIRRNDNLLVDAYTYYMQAIKDVCQLDGVSRYILETEIGVHFLGNPSLFEELLHISKLKGEIYE